MSLTARKLLLRERFRTLQDPHIYFGHRTEAAQVEEGTWDDPRLDVPVDFDGRSSWCYALDADYLYVPGRFSVLDGRDKRAGILCAKARRDQLSTIELSEDSIRAASKTELSVAVFQTVEIWSVPVVGDMCRNLGVKHVVGIGTWGYWFAAATEADAISALVHAIVLHCDKEMDA